MCNGRRCLRFVCLLALLLFLIVAPAGVSQAERVADPSLRPLADMLNPDGTLNLSTGYSGSLDPTGWAVTTNAHGAPRFVRADAPSLGESERGDLKPPSLTSPQAYPAPPSAAPDPTWDGRFGPSGVYGAVHAIAIGGRNVYVGGAFAGVNQTLANNIAHWDGQQWDNMLGGTGCAASYSCNDEVDAILAVGSDIYVGGRFAKMGALQVQNLARWDGQAWRDVEGGVTCSNSPSCGYNRSAVVNALAIQGDALYVGGQFDTVGRSTAHNIARWDGHAWSTLGSSQNNGVDGPVNAITVVGSDIYVGGQFTRADGQSANNIARWDGQAWHDLAGGVSEPVAALTYGYGLVYVGLSQTGTAGGLVNGSLFGWDGQTWLDSYVHEGSIRSILIDGPRFYIGGSFVAASDGSTLNAALAKWSGGVGGHWVAMPGLATTNYTTVYALANSGDTIYVGGNVSKFGDREIRGLAVWNGADWAALNDGTDNGVHGPVYAVAIDGSDVYVGGHFNQVRDILANNIARWDGTQWHALGEGVACDLAYPNDCSSGSVRAIVVAGNRVYIGGQFNRAGHQAAWDIAVWDGSAWSAVGVMAQPQYSDSSTTVNALALKGSLLYAGGDFTALSPISAKGIAVWNGQTWSELGGGVARTESYNSASVQAIAVVGAKVYVGGIFDRAGQLPVSNIARWDGHAWSDMAGGIDCGSGGSCYGSNRPVQAIAVVGSDVYVGGDFSHAGGVLTPSLARWDGSAWWPVGKGGFGNYYSTPIISALASNGSSLFVGGTFTSIDGVSANNLVKWDGANWFPLGSGEQNGVRGMSYSYSPAAVSGIGVTNRDVYVGGSFDSAGGWASVNFGHWHDPMAPTPTPNPSSSPTPLPSVTPTPSATFTLVPTFTPAPTPTPPANDDFVNAQVLTLPAHVEGTTFGATRETNEPSSSCPNGRPTVWYRVTPSSSGYLTISLPVGIDIAYDTADVYTGTSLSSLMLVACRNFIYQGSFEVQVTAGVTYYVRVSMLSVPFDFQGPFTLDMALETVPYTPTPTATPTPTSTATVTATPTRTPPPTNTPPGPPPVNDDFANAQAIPVPGQATGDTSNATNEAGERQPCGNIGKTVWYRVTPGTNGSLTATTAGSSFDTVMAIYSGTSLSNLTPLQCNDDDGTSITSHVTVPVLAGQRYYIQVGGFSGDSGAVTLHVSLDTSPATVTPTPPVTRQLYLPLIQK